MYVYLLKVSESAVNIDNIGFSIEELGLVASSVDAWRVEVYDQDEMIGFSLTLSREEVEDYNSFVKGFELAKEQFLDYDSSKETDIFILDSDFSPICECCYKGEGQEFDLKGLNKRWEQIESGKTEFDSDSSESDSESDSESAESASES